jgi:hypothetical protein
MNRLRPPSRRSSGARVADSQSGSGERQAQQREEDLWKQYASVLESPPATGTAKK